MILSGIRALINGTIGHVKSDIWAWQRLWRPERAVTDRVRLADAAHLLWHYQGLRATILYRIAHALWQSRIPGLPGVVTQMNLTLHGFDVPATIDIGPGLYIPHPVGTVVTARRIGANVTLVSGVTIGMRNEREFPEIGDDVFIGAGARVLGRITIGDRVNIGANAVVLTDVPPGATAVGVPARVKPGEKLSPNQGDPGQRARV